MGRIVITIALYMAATASPSVILEAPSIALVRIDTASPGAWRKAGDFERRRSVKLDLVVERVFKGPLHGGDKLAIDAEQQEAVGRYHAVGGAWSGKVLEQGRRYIVFAKGPETLRAADAAESGDVELALDFEKNGWPLGELDRRTGARRASLGRLFAEYLNARLPAAVAGGAQQWDSILTFFEYPDLTSAFRSPAAVAAMDAVLMQPPAPPPILQRTTIFGFRLLAMPDANGLHARLAQSYLPNLIGLEGSERKRSPAGIFSTETARQDAARAVAALPASAARDRLEKWLAAR